MSFCVFLFHKLFFRISSLKWNWRISVIWVTCFSGDSGFKNCSCLRKSRLQVLMFVCTQFSLCVWLYKGGRYSPLTLKTNAWWWWLMRNTQFACVFRENNGIHRSCSGKWNGLLVMILTCCERSKAHSRYTVSVMKKILLSEFLDSLKILSTCRKTQLHRQKLNWILRLAHGGDCLRLAERSL